MSPAEKRRDESDPKSSLVLYETEDGRTRIECRFEGDTIWLTQAQIATLFGTTPQNVTLHLKAIYAEGELDEEATCKESLQVRREGARDVQRALLHYSLPVILAVGYRVRSSRGTQFRQWATARLAELLVKGFVMDDERLKAPPGLDDERERCALAVASRRSLRRRLQIYVAKARVDHRGAFGVAGFNQRSRQHASDGRKFTSRT